jgi:23S rRNA pseudouridine2605 synthase
MMKITGKPDGQRRSGLARTLSKFGYCSRSQGIELVRSGRVAVGGVPRRDPEFPVRPGDSITVDGQPVLTAERVYLIMNKPRGLVTTASDEKDRATVYSLLPPGLPWVAPVGRLDQASEGLLLFTNDSEWAARISSPRSHLEKTYRVQISAIASQALMKRLCDGVTDRGEHLRAIRVSILRTSQKTSWLEIVLDQGRNRHIRRMLGVEGIEVLRLIRVAIGPLALGTLAKGQVRPLAASEKTAIDRALSPIKKPQAAIRKSVPGRA